MGLRWTLRASGRIAAPAAPRARWALRLVLGLAGLLVLVPAIDIAISGLFYVPGTDFLWRHSPVAQTLHEGIQIAARVLGLGLLIGTLVVLWRGWRTDRPPVLLGLGRRAWLFLFLALVVGPGLLANTVFKDMWDRARPWMIEEFGGEANFSPPLVISDQCARNCSFVSGDAAFAVYLHSFAYVLRRRAAQRAALAAGLAAGALAGLLRIGMGSHFFSDVVFAAIFMLLASAGLHALMFGRRRTAALWRDWLPWLYREG